MEAKVVSLYSFIYKPENLWAVDKKDKNEEKECQICNYGPTFTIFQVTTRSEYKVTKAIKSKHSCL